MVGMGRSGKLSHSNDVIGACICSNDDLNKCVRLHPLWVRGQYIAVLLRQLHDCHIT